MTARARSKAMGDPAADLPPDHGGLLVVDDEPFLRDAVAASLRFLGFDVTTAETGADALRLARGRPFDLVVLDVMLPDADGFDVVRRLRRDGCQVPVIFLPAGARRGRCSRSRTSSLTRTPTRSAGPVISSICHPPSSACCAT